MTNELIVRQFNEVIDTGSVCFRKKLEKDTKLLSALRKSSMRTYHVIDLWQKRNDITNANERHVISNRLS
jgi:hypothetical protein